MLRALALLSIGLVGTTAAFAADNGVYVGVAISQTSVDVDLHNTTTLVPVNVDNTRFKLIAGVRALDWFAVEMNYVDFGNMTATAGVAHGEYTLKGVDAFAVGLYEVALVDLYAKAGVVWWDQNASISDITVPQFDKSGYDAAYGAGVQLHFGSLGARLEYEKFAIGDTNASLISLGVTWTFL
jgi:hypothetical protein